MRLLPRDGYSWTGYIWLAYLSSPIWYLAEGQVTRPYGAIVTFAAIVLFLPLYFWGFWLTRRRVLAVIAAITLLGAVVISFNPGGFAFFVYASSFAGRVGDVRRGLMTLGALVAAVLIETWAVGLRPAAWGPALPLIALVGGLSVVFTEIGRRQTALRRAADEESRRLAVVGERERIGRDLHDLLGHTLSVITLKAELASKLVPRDPERAEAEMRDVERISRDALGEVRRVVTSYRHASFADELAQAQRALETAGVALDVHGGDAPLDPGEEWTLALVLREAVTNVIRHARARRCLVRLDVTDTLARLSIEDDGIGGAPAEGAGLSGMRERLAAIGGQMARDGSAGTRLAITLPRRGPARGTSAWTTA